MTYLFNNLYYNILFIKMQYFIQIFLDLFNKHTQKYIDEMLKLNFKIYHNIYILWLSPRFISIGQLNVLLHLHLQPIYHVVFMESYYLTIWDILS